MSLSINNNSLSLNAQRRLADHVNESSRLIGKLVSGARINGAADDPAGQAVSARMSSQLRGMSQAMRNINDGTSMLQVADSAMVNITESLQRLRELAVQSGDGAMSDSDRGALQQEANQILQQITQVGNETTFNGEKVFAQDETSIGGSDARKRVVLDGLKTGWLGAAEDMIKKYYGIEGKGSTMTVNVSQNTGPGGALASVSGNAAAMSLNIYMDNFGTAATPDGGSGPQYSDRIIAHEMAHAVMLSATSFNFNGAGWFTEGTAELIQGADERLKIDIANAGSVASLVSAFDSTYKYAGGYAASRYMHDELKGMGVEGGIKGVMQYMSRNQGADLSAALNAVSKGKWASVGAFETDFRANGATFINTRMNLTNADTGAIGGLDADGGPSRNSRDVVPDLALTSSDKPLRNFKLEMPELGGSTGVKRMQVQVGAQASDLIQLEFSAMNARALGLADLDMRNTGVTLLHIDQAIDFVGKQRVAVGAAGNRMDMVASNVQTSQLNIEAAKSRIQDVDYASATARLTRSQILQQAASAMLTQANGQPKAVLALLR
jgi:flagellin